LPEGMRAAGGRRALKILTANRTIRLAVKEENR
jgi:hypothetical protein